MYAYLILLCAILMQACLGATYSWAIFTSSLREITGLGQGLVQTPFTTFYIIFPVTAIFAGAIIKKLGPRWSTLIGGIIFGSGWLIAGLGKVHFLFTILGIGVLGGIGVGMAYVVPIATCILWFPRHKGLVTGLAVAGFGGGAAGVSQAGNYMMQNWNFTPYQAFQICGMVFMAIVGLAGLAMKNPKTADTPDSQTSRASVSRIKPPENQNITPAPDFKIIVTQGAFQILYLAMFCGLAAGFAINANLKQLSATVTTSVGVLAVSLFAITNALGRIIWGALFDQVHSPRRIIQINLAFQAALLFMAPFLLHKPIGLLLVAVIAGFNYGGVLVLYASSVATRWGANQVGYIYGWLFSSNIPASFAPLLAGCAYDLTGSFAIPLILIALLLIGAIIIIEFCWME